MSVKGKIKRLNKELAEVKQENIKQADHILFLEEHRNDKTQREKTLENILKFAITNHIGNLRGGMMVDSREVEKMQELKLDIERSPIENAYIMRIMY